MILTPTFEIKYINSALLLNCSVVKSQVGYFTLDDFLHLPLAVTQSGGEIEMEPQTDVPAGIITKHLVPSHHPHHPHR